MSSFTDSMAAELIDYMEAMGESLEWQFYVFEWLLSRAANESFRSKQLPDVDGILRARHFKLPLCRANDIDCSYIIDIPERLSSDQEGRVTVENVVCSGLTESQVLFLYLVSQFWWLLYCEDTVHEWDKNDLPAYIGGHERELVMLLEHYSGLSVVQE